MTVLRRDFLKSAGGFFVTFSLAPSMACAQVPVLAGKTVAKDEVDAWLAIGRDGRVTVFTGKVDLGTGLKTAYAQIAADELDVDMRKIDMVMGDTARTPDQWLTAASTGIPVGGMELRRAAATGRNALVARAAIKLGAQEADLEVVDGLVSVKGSPGRAISYADLVAGGAFESKVDPKVTMKPPAQRKLIGKPVPRVDIPAKVTGEFQYVADVRVPGMLHARVIRSDTPGAKPKVVNDSAAKGIKGYLQTVRKDDFLAVIADNEWSAVRAAQAITVEWSGGAALPTPDKVYEHWRKSPIEKVDDTQKVGDAAAAFEAAPRKLAATYEFAIQTHASIGPSCAVADFKDGKLTVWTPSQGPHPVLHEIAEVTGLAKDAIRLIYVDGSGCFGRNGHEDATADAALLATLIGKPVRVQWSRADETARSPKSPPTSIDLAAGLDAANTVTAWKGDFYVALNHLAVNTPLAFALHALTETGKPKSGNFVGFMFQNAAQPYSFPNIHARAHFVRDMVFRSSHLRSPGRLENNFATESFFDEIAAAVKADPAELRLQYIADPRAQEVIRKAMALAGWQPRPSPNPTGGDGRIAKGRGIAYVRYNNSVTYVAAVAEVEVDRQTGKIVVTRVCMGHDCGQMINPDGVANQCEGSIVQTVSRTLLEAVQWDASRVTSLDWSSYPIHRFSDVPKVELGLIDRPDQPPWGAGEPAAVPIPAAIGNAVYDAIGVRLRSVPFTPAKVKAALT